MAIKAGFFFGPFEKKSRTKKLKPRKNNSKLEQKTQGFGKKIIAMKTAIFLSHLLAIMDKISCFYL